MKIRNSSLPRFANLPEMFTTSQCVLPEAQVIPDMISLSNVPTAFPNSPYGLNTAISLSWYCIVTETDLTWMAILNLVKVDWINLLEPSNSTAWELVYQIPVHKKSSCQHHFCQKKNGKQSFSCDLLSGKKFLCKAKRFRLSTLLLNPMIFRFSRCG